MWCGSACAINGGSLQGEVVMVVVMVLALLVVVVV